MLLGGVAVLLVVNFLVFALLQAGHRPGRPLKAMTTELFLPLLPGELAVAVITIILVSPTAAWDSRRCSPRSPSC